MRPVAWWLGVAALFIPAFGHGGDWEIEASLGAARGSDFTRPAPFRFSGELFEGPYRTCDPAALAPLPAFPNAPDEVRCNRAMAYDASYAVKERFLQTGFVRFSIRRRLSPRTAGSSLFVGAGVLGGLAAKRERVFRTTLLGQVSLERPLEPESTFNVSSDPANANGIYTGVGTLAYVHLELRYELGPGEPVESGSRRSRAAPFFALGAGVLPVQPGGHDADIGGAPALHAQAGVRLHRRPSRDLTLSILYVKALADTGHLVASNLSWIGVGVGVVFESK